MATIASGWARAGRLANGGLVATVMSNLGLERFLTARGLRLERTSVGDRYVVEAMRRGGWNLGGEQSGHIVMTDYATTGDGLLTGVQVLDLLARSGRPLSALADAQTHADAFAMARACRTHQQRHVLEHRLNHRTDHEDVEGAAHFGCHRYAL